MGPGMSPGAHGAMQTRPPSSRAPQSPQPHTLTFTSNLTWATEDGGGGALPQDSGVLRFSTWKSCVGCPANPGGSLA